MGLAVVISGVVVVPREHDARGDRRYCKGGNGGSCPQLPSSASGRRIGGIDGQLGTEGFLAPQFRVVAMLGRGRRLGSGGDLRVGQDVETREPVVAAGRVKGAHDVVDRLG